MRFSSPFVFVICLLSFLSPAVNAVDFNGRFSMLGTTAQAEQDDWGYLDGANNALVADQQSVRLMLENGMSDYEWATHLRVVRSHTNFYDVSGTHSSALFRYADLSEALMDESDTSSSTVVRYEIDRLYYRYHLDDYSVSFGRQSVDWGSGRFWQPMNVFGSFSPTDLDTDYKPGIDSLVIDHYPSPFSSLSAVYAFAPQSQSAIKDSAAVHYRRQVGEVSELALLAGTITGNQVVGGSFESAWQGMGWRIEGVHYELVDSDESALFMIAGLDYQFDNGTLLSAEYYDNSRGAETELNISAMLSDEMVASGLQQQLSSHLWAVSLSRDLTPLLSGSYTLLAAAVEDNWSELHQFTMTYSVSNESDLLASLSLPGGKGLTSLDEPRSEFGHLPASFTLRLRFYF